MMGKLSSWRGGHDRSRGSSLGGLVSIDELMERKQPRQPPPAKKKTPGFAFSGLIKPNNTKNLTSFGPQLSSSPSSGDFENNNGSINKSNTTSFHIGSYRPSSAPGKHHSLTPRPRTADSTAVNGLTRQRSGTVPTTNPLELQSDLSWRDPSIKPLPLALDMEPRRNNQQTEGVMTKFTSENVGATIHRSKTSESIDSSIRRKPEPSKAQYTLVPQITTNFGERRGSHSATSSMTGTTSSTSSRYPGTNSSNSRTNSTRSTTTPRETPTSNYPSAIRNSILDEVEGTLSATITELQELQTHSIWQQPREQSPAHISKSASRSASISGPVPSIDSYIHKAQKPSLGNNGSNSSNGSNGSIGTDDSHDTIPTGTLQANKSRNSLSPPPLNPTRSLQSSDGNDDRIAGLEDALEEQISINSTLTSENDALRQRLELLQRRLATFESEKPSLVRAAKDAEGNLQLTLSKLREAKVSELAAQKEFQSSRNTISILETRCAEEQNRHDSTKEALQGEKEKSGKLMCKLEEVNAQKVDLLEGNVEMRKDVIVTRKKLKKVTEELNTLKRKEKEREKATQQGQGLAAKLEDTEKKVLLLESELSKLRPNSDLPSRVADLTFQLEDAQLKLNDQQALVESLTLRNDEALALVERFEQEVRETRNSQSSPSSSSSPQTQNTEVERENWQLINRKYEEAEAARRSAVADRDRVLELLRAEVRRIAVEEHGVKHPSLPFLKKRVDVAEAVELVKGRAKAYLKDDKDTETRGMNGHTDPSENDAAQLQERVTRLEEEIDYYLKDIVLYKLDVKGYKKDLKKAEKRIKDLENGDVTNGTYTGRISAMSPTVANLNSLDRVKGLNLTSPIGEAL